MSIVNRRNAVVGWGVWKLGKRVVRRKAKSDGPPTKSLVAVAIAGAAGALTFWRKRGSGSAAS
ncbi:MAG: hypothetical protein E6G15_10940 [Actinobacteria bacterium]|nr:MAG: hypothetical protein E6G15_10940 [Actinomycetota bacterium]